MVAEKITSLYTAEKKRHTTRGKGKGAVVKADTPVVAATEKDAQEELLQILKTFDMTTKFGPALGLTRLERWERAEKLNLSPPADVFKILTEIDAEGKWANNVWEGLV